MNAGFREGFWIATGVVVALVVVGLLLSVFKKIA